MLKLILNIILYVLCVVYLVKNHTWYQIALLGLVCVALGLLENFTDWQLDVISCFYGMIALIILNLKITIEKEEEDD